MISLGPLPGGASPSITSPPIIVATQDAPYSYNVAATDPNAGDVLTFSLDFSPLNMTVDPSTGLIQWTPSAGQVGAHAVRVLSLIHI